MSRLLPPEKDEDRNFTSDGVTIPETAFRQIFEQTRICTPLTEFIQAGTVF